TEVTAADVFFSSPSSPDTTTTAATGCTGLLDTTDVRYARRGPGLTWSSAQTALRGSGNQGTGGGGGACHFAGCGGGGSFGAGGRGGVSDDGLRNVGGYGGLQVVLSPDATVAARVLLAGAVGGGGHGRPSGDWGDNGLAGGVVF